jgi:hypothetical protein
MDAADLHLKLLECGECLIRALAEERRAGNSGSRSHLARQRLRRAGWEVEQAAEYYALALKAFRTALLSEFLPNQADAPEQGAGRDPEGRELAKPAAASHRSGHAPAKTKITRAGILPRRILNFQ